MAHAYAKSVASAVLVAAMTVASVAAADARPGDPAPQQHHQLAGALDQAAAAPVALRRPRGTLAVHPRTAVPGDAVTIRGRLAKAKKRTVVLQMSAGGSWKTIAKVRTNRKGVYAKRVQLPTYAADAVPQSLSFRGKLKGKLKVKRHRYTVKTNVVSIPDVQTISNYEDGDQWVPFGNFFLDLMYVWDARPGTFSGDSVRVWNPNTSYSTLELEDDFLPSGWTAEDTTWTSSGTPTAPLMVADTVVRVPGSGVTPAHSERRLYVVDTRNDRLVRSILVESGDSLQPHVMGSTQGSVAVVGLETVTRAYNLLTGAVVWESQGPMEAATYRSALVSRKVGNCWQLQVLDNLTGSVVRTLSTAGVPGTDACSFDVYAFHTWGFASDAPLHLRWYQVEVGSAKEVRFNIDGWTGTDAVLPDITSDADPESNLVVEYLDVTDHQVRDSVTGTAYFRPDPDLEARVKSLTRGRLYLSTPDGTPVVDAVTGRVLANNASSYPVATIGSWTLWSSGRVSPWPYAVSP